MSRSDAAYISVLINPWLKYLLLLIFSTSNCYACTKLEDIVKLVNINIVIIREDDPDLIGKHFAITASPTTIYINNNCEVSRFYGAKDIKYIKKFIKENEI